jgi:hypothetical protein
MTWSGRSSRFAKSNRFASHFKADAHDADGLGIEAVAAGVRVVDAN